LGLALSDRPDVWALAADTDGIDGSEDNAGAVWTPHTLAVAASAGSTRPIIWPATTPTASSPGSISW
jgi:glycerate-2-kinase